MRQAGSVPPAGGAALDGKRRVLVVGFALQPSDDRKLPIEAAAADAESARDRGVPPARVDNPITSDLIAFDAESPIAWTRDGNETYRLTQDRPGINGALPHLRSEGAAVEQPPIAERMQDEILMAQCRSPPRSANPDTIDMPIQRQQP